MELNNSRIPRKVKERMICEYTSGVKTASMLSKETGMSTEAIRKMVSRYRDRFLPTLDDRPIVSAAMRNKSKTVSDTDLMREIDELRRQLKDAQLKIEGYKLMGDILEERYGIDLLKKSEAKQLPGSGKDMQK
uniref:hypothetical protein n=1 Tax=Pedobacter schmidteae TaxID=2201271 RepID=UPI0013CE94E6|nr:hypothetical protein [Pedobacter schmidteae]